MLPVTDESTRVCLQPIRGVDGSDYINASFIDVSRLTQVKYLYALNDMPFASLINVLNKGLIVVEYRI